MPSNAPAPKAEKVLQKRQPQDLKEIAAISAMNAPVVEPVVASNSVERMGAEWVKVPEAEGFNAGYANGLLDNGVVKRAKQVAWSDVQPK